jgi:tetratricopeptide (TPR) repeat protein
VADDTTYLDDDPEPDELPQPPVESFAPELPLDQLSWRNFERLCLRLARRLGAVEHAQLYGNAGQDQKGIDIYARLGSGDYYVFQCRRTKQMRPADIERAVSDFLTSEWVDKASTFVLCAAQTFVETGRADAVETEAARLKQRNKVFLPWGRDILSDRLRRHRDLVRLFFGDAWETAFCGEPPAPSAAELLPAWAMREPGPTFAYRDEDLETLDRIVSSSSARPTVIVLHGLGGVGKTQLAAAWGRKHRDEYSIGVWAAGRDATAVTPQLADFARSAGVAATDDDQIVALEKLRTILSSTSGWLLVLDDFDEVADLLTRVPRAGAGTVVVTSRRSGGWRGVGAVPVEVGLWNLADATTYLCAAAGDQDEDAGEAIARALGRLPLAVAQAAAYVDETGTSLASYLRMLETHAPELLDANRAPDYEVTVRTTWHAAFEQVAATSQVATTLANALCYLASGGVPRQVLEQLALGVGSDALDLDRARSELLRFSLVQSDGDGVVMHTLVGMVMRERLREAGDRSGVLSAIAALLETMPRHFETPQSWPAGAQLLPHALALAGHIEEEDEFAESAAELVDRCASYLTAMSDFRAAAALFTREDASLKRIPDLDDVTYASFLNDYGSVVRDLGRLKDAQQLLRRALQLKEQKGAPPWFVASTADNLGQVEQRLGNFDVAHQLFARALRLLRAAYGDDHVRVAMELSNIGTLRIDEGDLAGARRDLQHALDIVMRLPATQIDRSWHEARVRGNLGEALLDLGDAAGALTQQELALQLKQELFDGPHADVADTIGNLGNVLLALGEPEGAIALHEESLAMTEQVLGPISPRGANTLHNLANALEANGEADRAAGARERAASIAAVLGIDWPPRLPDGEATG